MSRFEPLPILSYLGLASEYTPAPDTEPIAFLTRHLGQLTPSSLRSFSLITTPQQRTVIPTIRNRRFKFCDSAPPELCFAAARRLWPTLWEGRGQNGAEDGPGAEEKEWVNSQFMHGERKPYVGKLGALLGDYEEEREADRIRMLRREQAASEKFIPEEDESSDEEGFEGGDAAPIVEDLAVEQALFLRRVRERFIYGLLETDIYDRVDWDDAWDVDDDAEERWFEEDDGE